MAEAVAAVRFDISAETAKLQEGVRRANVILGQLRGQASGIEAAFNRLGNLLAGVFAVGSIANFISHAVEAGAKVDDLADQAGLSAEAFQQLSFALRNSGVEQEQLSAAFAFMGRQLSDMNRGTGALLQFTREYAPLLGQQLRGVRDTSEAFRILTAFISQLPDKMDQLRVAQVALGRQGSKLAVEAASLGDRLVEEMQRATREGRTFTAEQARELEQAKQAWVDFGNLVVVQTGRIIAAISNMTRAQPPDISHLEQSAERLRGIISRLSEGTAQWRVRVDELRRIQEQLNAAIQDGIGRGLASSTTVTPVDPLIESTSRIKAAQAALQSLQSQLQAMPPAIFQMGDAFRQALGAQVNLINLTADAEQRGGLISAAANQMRLQAYQAYVAALGASMPLQEQYNMRVAQINLAIADTAMKQLALNQAQLDYQMGLMNLASQMGAVVTPMEAYRLKLEQIAQTIRSNPELAGRMAGANTKAAATMIGAYAGAASEIASNLSQMFQKNKGLAAAAAIISGLAGAARAIEIYGPTPWGWALAASAAALGVANAAKILSQSEDGRGGSAASSVAPTVQQNQAPQMQQSQALQIMLPQGRYTHEEVMTIIEGINERVQNGATLISTKIAA